MYDLERIMIEVISATVCFILVRFMIKPYRLTGETRYLGLPFGFGFLGASYTFSALSYSPLSDYAASGPVQLLVRAFAFLFLAVTYYFSKSERKTHLLWNMTLSVLACTFTILVLLATIYGQFLWLNYQPAKIFISVFNLICLTFISIHALKSHIEQSDPTTLMIPLGYVLLGINQYSLLIWAVDSSFFALFAGLTLRLAGLAVFLFVSFRTFYSPEKRENR